jgi:hypothetical protein
VPAENESVYRPRKPSSAPSEGSLAERDAFTAVARQSLQEVRSSADAWRNGLTAFLTLVTTGVIIKGRDTTAGLATPWRIAVTLLIGGGLVCAVAGLWQVLAAQAGTRHRISSGQELRRRYGSVDMYHVAVAAQAIDKLNTGRRFVVAALTLLLAGVAASWWAPSAQSAPTYVQVTSATTSTCGTLRSGNGGQIALISRENRAITLPLNGGTRITVVSACP